MKSDVLENVVLYDWLTISCKSDDPEILKKLVSLKDVHWEVSKKGANGYKQGFFCNNISVWYDGNEGMGSCLNMSGQGCRAFEEFGTGDFDSLFQLVLDNPLFFNITRLDVAFDDHTGIFDIQQLFYDCDNREFVSKFRKSKICKEFDDSNAGISIYHGSEKSVILFRIYDKAAERHITDGQHWIRAEMQLRDERALAFISDSTPIGQRFRGVFSNYVRYVDESFSDDNRWRWPMKSYWEKFLDEAEKISLYVKPGLEYNIMQLDRFVFEQAGNAISAAMQIHGLASFFDRIEKRSSMGNPKYDLLIEEYGNTKENER